MKIPILILTCLALTSCEVITHYGNGKPKTEIVPPWELEGGMLNPWWWFKGGFSW